MIRCFFESIKNLFKYRIWIRHLLINPEIKKGIVITTENGFRVSDSLTHGVNEQVHQNVYIETCTCKFCGKKISSWSNNKSVFEY